MPLINKILVLRFSQVGSRLLADSKAVALSLELEAATARLLHRRREGERMEEESAR